LDSVSGQSLNGVAVGRYEASEAVARSFEGCSRFIGASQARRQTDCIGLSSDGGTTERGTDNSSLGFNLSSATIRLNGQRETAPGWFVAGSLRFETNQLGGAQGVSATGQGMVGGISLRRQDGPLRLSATADFGYGDYDTTRTITVGATPGSATGSLGAFDAGAHLRAAYQLPFDRFYLQPSLDLAAIYVGTGSYNESGFSPLALSQHSANNWFPTALPSLEVGSRFDLTGGAVLKVSANVGALLVAKNSWTSKASFSGDPLTGSFQSRTSIPASAAEIGLGVGILSGGNVEFNLRYSADLSYRFAQIGTARLAYHF
jgi:hypothetical protein